MSRSSNAARIALLKTWTALTTVAGARSEPSGADSLAAHSRRLDWSTRASGVVPKVGSTCERNEASSRRRVVGLQPDATLRQTQGPPGAATTTPSTRSYHWLSLARYPGTGSASVGGLVCEPIHACVATSRVRRSTVHASL